MKAIADTGFIVAFLSRDDQHHEWALGIADRVSAPLLTCEPVLAESVFQVGSCSAVLTLLQENLLQLAFDLNRNLDHLAELAHTYEDRKPDLADLCLIRMSELYPRHVLVTVDVRDFRIYRRNKREAIPVLHPPRIQ